MRSLCPHCCQSGFCHICMPMSLTDCFLLFIFIILLILITDIDHILMFPSTTFKIHLLALIRNQTAFLLNIISYSYFSLLHVLFPHKGISNILSCLHCMENFSSLQTQVNIYLHVTNSPSSAFRMSDNSLYTFL